MPLCIRRVFPESSRYARQVFHPHPVPSPLKGEGFHCLSVCYRTVFHRTFDNISLENKMFRACLRQNPSSEQAFCVSTNDRNKIKTLCITMPKALSVFNPQGGDIRMVSKGAD